VLAIVLFHLGAGVAGVEAYIESVPLPGVSPVPQASVLYYRDGRTILARVGVTDHSDVSLSEVPVLVRQAVLAAEDRDFYSHGGVSPRGVVRALVADVGGDTQGASTITQQYARNAFLTQKVSIDRKAKEFALAVKLERQYSKDEILARYLNIVYFGRGAYGIAAAAHAYFGVSPGQLTLAQGAVLAAVIKNPGSLDPAVGAADATFRWRWIISAMRAAGWIDQTTAAATQYPAVLARSAATDGIAGPNGLIVDQVERELAAHGVTSQMLHTAGLSVVTTIDPDEQAAALKLARDLLRAQPTGLRAALVAVDPASGGVRAYYGGDHGSGYFDDAAAPRPPASTFKPVALAAGLQSGISYLSHWDGSSPRIFPDRNGVPLANHDDLQCPSCTLQDAMVQSLNTPFYALTEQIGPATVRTMATDLGVPPVYGAGPSLVDTKGDPRPGQTRADIAIGRYPVAPADMATVYATFAANGIRSTRYFVESAAVAHTPLFTAKPDRRKVLAPRIAGDVTTVLRAVVDRNGFTPGRVAAGKTGSQQWANTRDSQDAWMVGYTPQLATAVWIGRAVPGPIRDSANNPINGETLPAQLWRSFLQAALRGQPERPFPAPAHVGRTDAGDAGRLRNPDQVKNGRAPQGIQPVVHTAHQGRYLALTFDDGPSEYTPQVLDVLARYHIKATFCVVADNVAQYPAVIGRMVEEGHALCNHSTHHDDLGRATQLQIADDVAATDAAIAAASARATVTYFRAPYGDWGKSARVGADLGHTPLGWLVDPQDWARPGTDQIVASVQSQLTDRAVVLLHDGGGDRQQTVEALNDLIPRLLAQGWTFDRPEITVRPHRPDPTPSPSAAADPRTSATPTPSSGKPAPKLGGPSANP